MASGQWQTGLAVLIGDPVAHSVSPAIHAAAFASAGIDAAYVACRVSSAGFEAAVGGLWALGAMGANVTAPHKLAALRAASEASDEALAVGAANTLVRGSGGWRAENTDVAGFLAPLDVARLAGKTAVVLGAGGAARAVVYALATRGLGRVVVAARDVAKAETLARDAQAWASALVEPVAFREAPVRGAALVVNATSVGTGDPDATPWAEATDFDAGQTVYDLVYRPTRLLREAQARGATVLGGLPMLVAQAAASFRLWTSQDMDVPAATRAARHALGLPPAP